MLSDKQVKHYYQKLMTLKQELQDDIELAQDSAKTVELDQTSTGRVSRGDALQQQAMAKAGLERDQKRFIKVIKALSRISDDDYGWCLQCDEPISEKRLEIMPEAEFCIDCEAKKETQQS
jgi:DnaK suppressor protein